ncbi:MAG: hypothetical protein N2738_00955 [Thermodesulfovibrionales bacterium]|nr:hypothetical protein [Thermodesulfovibrionales bacterium]
MELYKKIAPKIGEQEASDLIVFIEDAVRNSAVTKADLERTARELETNFNNKISALETDLRAEISGVESSLRKEISDIRKEMSEFRKELSEMRGLLLKFILPMSSIIGAIVGTVISFLIK